MTKEFFQRYFKGDPVIWFILFFLSLISLMAVYSATGTLAYRRMSGNTEYYLFKHGSLVVLGVGVAWAAHRIDYRYYRSLSRLALFGSLVLLPIAYLFGRAQGGASRWITIPVVNQTFQPSDLAKLALISAIAGMLSKRQSRIEDIRTSIAPMMAWIVVICGMIALSNFSTAIMLFATSMLLLYIGRVPTKYFGYAIGIGLVVGMLAFSFGQRGATFRNRISNFVSGKPVFQAEQSFIAIAGGGILGRGPGNSHQKDFLPEPYSDFIYAIIIEEYGLIGGICTLGLYLLLLYRGMQTVMKSNNAFGGLLSAGLSFIIVIQAFMNMAVAVGLVPVTGQPLPLVSMGGTSLLFTGAAFGIILSVSRGEIDEETQPNPVRSGHMNTPRHVPSL